MYKPVRTATLSIRISPEVKKFLQDEAKKEEVSVSDIFHKIVREYKNKKGV